MEEYVCRSRSVFIYEDLSLCIADRVLLALVVVQLLGVLVLEVLPEGLRSGRIFFEASLQLYRHGFA